MTTPKRRTFIVKTNTTNPEPVQMTCETRQNGGHHGCWAASAAGGSGSLSNGKYAGAAPEADLFLIESGPLGTAEQVEKNIGNALLWVKHHAEKYGIRGIVLTVIGQRDTGLLPWQADPLRILCEELVHAGILVVAASGNNAELTSSSVISPSVLAVDGVSIPECGKIECAAPFPGSKGVTFDGKRNPDILAPAMNVVLPYPFASEEERLRHYTAVQDHLPDHYARQWGTSYAAPIVLGLAACLWQIEPALTAEQVKMALRSSSELIGKRGEVQAGLVSPEVFNFNFNLVTDTPYQTSPFESWRYWKKRSLPERLEKIQSRTHHVVDILLSFLPEALPLEAICSVQKLLYDPSDKVKTAAVTVLSTQPSSLNASDLLHCLSDKSASVRMGGLYALGLCPNLWEELTPSLCILINDENTDIRYNACKLAVTIKSQRFIEALINGLTEDARNKRIGTFGKRVVALEAITGVHIPRDPEWQEGEDPYSRRSIHALLKMAAKWKSLFNDRAIGWK